MKNRVIKKIMAYLLVGAMVISTPMTASANELENAYSSNTVDGEGSNTDTDTSTNTSGEPVDVPVLDVIKENNFNILGLQLDKESLELEVGDKAALHVRVLLDDYDANDEELVWANIDADTRAEIEGSIHWISENPKVATAKVATGAKDDSLISRPRNTDAIIEAIGNGQTKVTAWIEADGKAYQNAPNFPTDGDLKASATVTVRGGEVSITFDEVKLKEFAYEKRTYDLQKYTYVDGVPAAEATEKLTYSKINAENITATLSEDGKLKITKATGSPTAAKITFRVVAENGKTEQRDIGFIEPMRIQSFATVQSVVLDCNPWETVHYVYQEKEAEDALTVDEDGVYVSLLNIKPANTTDDFEWVSKKPAIVKVEPSADGRSAKLVPMGVGTADITVKPTNTKAKTIKVYVNATPDGFLFVADTSTYTGKPTSTKLSLGYLDYINNKVKFVDLPESAYTYKWNCKDKTNATIKKVGKLNEATITPKNILNGGNIPNEGVATFDYTCAISYKHYYIDKATSKIKTDTIKTNKKLMDFGSLKEAAIDGLSGSITIKQSNVADITISEGTLGVVDNKPIHYEGYPANSAIYIPEEIVGKLPNTTSSTRKTYTDKIYQYSAAAYEVDGLRTVRVKDKDLDNAIAWSVSGKVATISSNGVFTPTASGKTNITASYVSLKYNSKNGKYTAQVKKKTVPVQIIQNATAIGFQKPVQVKADNGKPQTVAVKISNVTPKKATYKITSWKVIAYGDDGTGVDDLTVIEDGIKNVKNVEVITLDAKDKNGNFRKDAKIGIPANIKAGTVIKVAAYTDGGVVATGYIYVTDQAKKVVGASSLKNTKADRADATSDKGVYKISIGESYKITPKIQTSTEKETVAWIEGKLEGGNPKTYSVEPVTYSVDKNSAKYIRVTNDGKIVPLQPSNGKKVTVTIKTLSGKSGKVTLIVE